MILLYLGALALMFAAAAGLVYAAFPSRSLAFELRSRTEGQAEAALIQSPLFRLLWPLLAAMAPYAKRLGSPAYREAKGWELPLSGMPRVMTVDHLLAFKVVLAACLPLLGVWLGGIFMNPVALGGLAVAGYFLPDRMVTEQRRAREQRILRALPSAVDMLTLAVEAGMDFLSGLQRVVDKGASGPLREEIMTIVNDIRIGDTRTGALKSFSRRINIPEIISFVGVLVQAERLGAPVGSVLRSQADRMRTERFQRAEREGAKASQKLLLPLAVFIFPAVMLVIIGPVALSFIYGGSPF
jgi:tight adherence protein C